MIRKTLLTTKLATFSIDLPNLGTNIPGMPTPTGTGFFVSQDGWFITAAHVITTNGYSDGPLRNDIDKAWLIIESPIDDPLGNVICQFVKFDYIDPETDFALLKVDFQANSNKDHWKDKTGFPYLEVSRRQLDEGEPVYAFGYPLPTADLLINAPGGIMAGHFSRSPRVTSAIIASSFEKTKFIQTANQPKVYALDKALNYGNSGGPIIAVETGKVHAFCSRFQPVRIIQEHLKDKDGNSLPIEIPSLYGIVSSLNNPNILEQLNLRGIPISEK